METKEEKKERRQGYFARLKKKRLAKQNGETTSTNGTAVCRTSTGKDDVISAQTSGSQENCKHSGEKEDYEKKKKKSSQIKDIRRTDLKRFYITDDNQTKTNEKKEKKMVSQRPHGTIEYTAGSQDTLNSIALKFNITPNKLVELNKLFTHTIVPGQVLYVPDTEPMSTAAKLASSSPGATVSPSSSDAEYDKLPDADLARKACRPLHRVLSSTSEEDEPVVVKFLKMNCRYFTDGKGVVGGVMIVTPNTIMFDPHKSDPLVIENGCEEYGLLCPMEEVVSIALYNDISHMKIKDALPSDIPKDLCPLYRPVEWEDLASEKDINPFSKFKSMSKEKKKQKADGFITLNSKLIKSPGKEKPTDFDILKSSESSFLVTSQSEETPKDSIIAAYSKRVATEQSGERISLDLTKDNSLLKEDSFIDLEESSAQIDSKVKHRDSGMVGVSQDCKTKEKVRVQATNEDNCKQLVVDSSEAKEAIPKDVLDSESCEKLDVVPEVNKGGSSPTNKIETTLDAEKELNKDKLIEFYLNKDKGEPQTTDDLTEVKEERNNIPGDVDLTLSSSHSPTTKDLTGKRAGPELCSVEKKDLLSNVGSAAGTEKKELGGLLASSLTSHLDSNSEIRLWLLQRIQVPIEDMLPSKEEKSKAPPMFLCIKVGKPMRKSFSSQSSTMAQQYSKKRKQPEYWFAVPRERVDHLYTFFVQWSPDVYGKDAKDQGFVVVEKDELDMIDNFFSEPSTKSWEIITVEEAKRRKSVCSYCEEDDADVDEDDDALPVLKNQSALLENMHVEQLARCLPARVQGYPWRLIYSTQEHGTSLKTLYRKSASLDSPVLLVVKDMDNQIFGAYATHPFRLSDHYYGTGETLLFTFNPLFKVFKWSGENTYFINGDVTSLELGGGDGRFGLWLDADLYHGRSNCCSTFNNDILSKKEDFVIQDVEVWTFE
uniref:Nuclear receptor coactivator 7 n=1 Tax=Anolis carolinensis TaxID=28377 RepID=G1KA58_ANOCA|nr:PREDICTED: nuclear receptor coactivator 7 isoform X3 [Anolis carolinensis]|eukprot:XP_008118064.1 PREDICTED: nuclear receptor coactivator 7 isoform X3 [Anolis carolinensis]